MDSYETGELDESDYDAMSMGDRRDAERAMKKRDAEMGVGNMRRGLFYGTLLCKIISTSFILTAIKIQLLDESDDDEDGRPTQRKRRLAERAAEGMEIEDEQAIESIENLEDMQGYSVSEWVSLLAPRTEILNRFKNFLRTYTDAKGVTVFKEKIRHMCEGL